MTVRIQPSTGETKTLDRVRDVHMACHSGGSVHLLVEPFKPTESIAVVKLRSLALIKDRASTRYAGWLVCVRCELAQTYEYCIVATQGRKDKQSVAVRWSERHQRSVHREPAEG